MKILIIQDEPQLAADIGEYLSSEDYLCEFAVDFDQAREKIALYSYDCILRVVMSIKTLLTASTNEEFMVCDVSDIEVSEASGTIDLIYEGEKVAQIKGKKIIITATDYSGTDFT